MKKVIIILLTTILMFGFTACGGSSEETTTNDSQTSSQTTEAPKRDLPEGNYEDIGDGSFYLTGPSGSTENGDEIVLYPEKDKWPHAYLGIEVWDVDGSVQTFIYVDGVEKEKQQVGAGYQGSIDFMDEDMWALTEGEHKVEAVQYADNDPSGEMIFYRSAIYTVKAE